MLESLQQLTEAAPRLRLLCVGDVMLDRYVHGRAARISPEAPVPVLAVERDSLAPGGAANVAANLAALGVNVELFGLVGEDAAAADLRAAIAGLVGLRAHLQVLHGRPTTEKTRYVVGGQQLLRADRETVQPPSSEALQDLLQAVQAALPGADVLVLSDYAKGVLAGGFCKQLVVTARAQGVPVLVDPKGCDYSRYAGANLITPNLAELALALGAPLAGDAAVVAGAAQLASRIGIDGVLVTRSADGMTLVDTHHPAGLHIRSAAREVFDVSGAGDTVVAVLAACLAAGLPASDAARLANLAAGVAVARHGTVQVSLHDLRAELDHERLAIPEASPVFASVGRADTALPAGLAQLLNAWRAAGHRIGFTNGCFDLLHAGHLHSLAAARAQCDRLVVGLNADDSVRRLKGVGRPVQAEAVRAAVLAHLRMVDAVCVFVDDTPADLVAALRPDVLFKGADYAGRPIAGAETVLAAGGRVVLLDLLPGYSTTSTLAALAGASATDSP